MKEIRLLRADEIECRAQSVKSNGCVLLLYKDARTDMNLLDETFGNGNWQRTHEVINDNLFCNLDVWDMDKKCWVRKQDVGVESNTEKEKGQASDAFKRAGFNVGIGRELYTAPFIWINLTEEEVDNSRGKPALSFKVKFKVSHITYNDKREISELEIKDQDGKVRFSMGTKTKAEQPRARPPKSEIDGDLKQAKEAISKCKNSKDLMVVWDKFKNLQGVAEFKNEMTNAKKRFGTK
ncbi:hypothetical protein DSECCO2_547990 [anaerobic digester metagenome]